MIVYGTAALPLQACMSWLGISYMACSVQDKQAVSDEDDSQSASGSAASGTANKQRKENKSGLILSAKNASSSHGVQATDTTAVEGRKRLRRAL